MAVFTAIGATLFGAGTFLAGATTILLQTAAGIGLNLLAREIAGTPSGPEKPSFSVRGKLQAGGDIPRSFMLGRGMTAGSLVYANEWGEAGGTPNAYSTQVIALSDMPVKSLDQVWINGEKVTLDDEAHPQRGYPVLEYRLDGKDCLWVKFHDGTQTTADSFLVNKVGSDQRPYEDTRVGVGVAYAICTARINEELFTGFPAYKFVVNGVRLYDPSKDSSSGGDGDHRWNNPATWGGNGDYLPAVQVYNILRGMSFDEDWFYGLQSTPSARIPAADWIAQIAKCRAHVDGPDGEEDRFRASGEIAVSAEVGDTVEALLTACQGRLTETGGTYKIHVGGPDTAVATISDGVILSTEEQSFTPFFGLAETITGISATYPSPAEGWTTKVAPPRIDPDLEELAGNRRLLADVSLDLVPYKAQVQRLMKSALKEAQRARRHTIVLPPEFWPLEPGDYINWTSARNGYETKKFRVDGVLDKANLDIVVDITEVDPSDYDWDQDTDYRAPVDGAVGISRPAPQVITGFGVEGTSILNDAGTAMRPAIRLFWDWSDDDRDIEAVAFQVRLESSARIILRSRTDEPGAGEVIIAPNSLLRDTLYEVRARFITVSKKRAAAWSEWLLVETPDVGRSDWDIYLPNLQREIRDFFQDRDREFLDFFDRLETLAANVGVANAEDIVNRQVFKKEIANAKAEIIKEQALRVSADEAMAQDITIVSAQVGENKASIINETTARVSGDSALASDIGLLQTSVGNVSAAVLNESEARADGDEALALSVTAVQAIANNGTAEGLMRWVSSAGPTGFQTRFSIEGRADDGKSYRVGGMYMDVSPTTARFVFRADQFLISNGAVNGLPFEYAGSTLKVANVVLGTLKFDQLESNNGKLVIRGAGSDAYIDIFA